MSYDIWITDEEGNTLTSDELLQMRGGTYAVGGTHEATLNITYNYGVLYRKVFGRFGIRSLYGKTGREAIPLLEAAIARLGTKRSPNYWDATSGNAGAALADLLVLCRMFPDGRIEGD